MIKGIGNNPSFISTISSNKESEKPQSVEKSKIDSLKEDIKNGNYKIDINSTAKNLAKSLL